MSDIGLKIIEQEPGRFVLDIDIEASDFFIDDGLETAVLMSMFTHQRITDEERPLFEQSLGGWWGDTIADIEGDQIGSKLWILRREKQLVSTLESYIDNLTDGLQWLIDDGVASDVVVDAQYVRTGVICVTIQIDKFDGTNEEFEILWDAQAMRRA